MGTNEVLAIALAALKKGGGGGGGTSNYNSLENKPQINGITLQGNKTSADLDIFDASELIALEFDSTQAYPLGDIVIYEHELYQFTTAHTAGDPWDATEVQQTTIAEILKNKPDVVVTSEANYNALSNAEKHDLSKIYFLYDAGGGGGGGTDNYNSLSNKPQINSVTLQGNKSFDDLGIGTDIDLEPSQLTDLLNMIP